MDETEDKTTETPVPPPAQKNDPAAELADDIRADAKKALHQIEGHGFRDFFNFDRLIFPSIARIVFLVFTIAMVVVGLLGIVAGFASMPEAGFFSGFADVCMAIVCAAFMIVMARIWIEIVLVAFKINDGVQDIKTMLVEKLSSK